MTDGIFRFEDEQHDIVSAEIMLPIDGVPTYALAYGGYEAPPSGQACTVQIGASSFAATVARATAYEGRVQVHAVGGNGALSADLAVAVAGRGYISLPAHLPLEELLGEIGVEATPETVAAAEGFAVARWQRIGGSAASAISTLARAAGLTWRVLADGRLWMAQETWPEYDHTVLNIEDDIASLSMIRAAHIHDVADLAPGMTVGGRQITRVVYSLTPYGLRLTASYRAAGPGTVREALAGAVARSAPPTGYGGVYEARIARQYPNGNVDVITGLPDVDGPEGVVAIPLRIGIARARQVLPEGHLVRLRFEASERFPAGDPSKPYAEAIEQDVSADRGIARIEDTVRIKLAFITATTVPLPTSIGVAPVIDGIPRIDLMITVTPGQDDPTGGGIPVPYVQIIETDGEIITASEEVYLK